LIKDKAYHQIPKFPATVRDMALVVDSGVTHQQILDTMKGFSLVTDVALFDVYSGGQVPAGKKSMAYRLTFPIPDRPSPTSRLTASSRPSSKAHHRIRGNAQRIDNFCRNSYGLLSNCHFDMTF